MLEIKTVRGTETREFVSQKEWLAARLELLKAEKELTRRGKCGFDTSTDLARTAPDYNPRTPASNRSISSGVV
jgi:hypothetical protein